MFQRGAHFANHTIISLRRTGPMALVYEVISASGPRRALKVVKPEVAPDAKTQARLKQEGEALATIESLHVERFHDAGVWQGIVWILMELVDGPDLRTLMAQAGGALPVERVVSIARQACEGLAAAHDMGIFHRDVRPENILVVGEDLAKVTSFSSAKLKGTLAGSSRGVGVGYGVETTDDDEIASTQYSAPEGLRGDAVGPANDVYSMGVTIYELLTGKNPIVPDPVTVYVAVQRHVYYEPPPLESLGLEIPGDLSHLVARAMSKDPTLRPTMRELAAGLATVLHWLLAWRRGAARSVPLATDDPRMAMTQPAMLAAGFEQLGAVPVAAVWSSAPSQAMSGEGVSGSGAWGSGVGSAEVSSRGVVSRDAVSREVVSGAVVGGAVSREAVPPRARVEMPETMRSASAPAPASASARSPVMATVAMSEVGPAPGAERASTGVPVERSVTQAPQRRWGRGQGIVVGLGAGVLALGLLGVGWMLGRGLIALEGPPVAAVAAPAPAMASAAATATASAAVSSAAPSSSARVPAPAVTADAGAPRPKASSTAAPARPRAAPQRGRLPFQ